MCAMSNPGQWEARLFPAKISIARFLLTVELRDEGVLFTCTECRRSIVVFLGDAGVAVIEERAGEMRVVATIDGGGRCAGGPEQMGRDVYTDGFAGELRDQGAEVLGGELPPGG